MIYCQLNSVTSGGSRAQEEGSLHFITDDLSGSRPACLVTGLCANAAVERCLILRRSRDVYIKC